MLPRDLLILLSSNSSQPWAKIFLGSGRSGGHQERRPEDRVEAQNLLADQVQVGGPEALALDRRLISDERVEPDVEDVRRFAFHRNAPLDICAGDRKIGQALAHEGQHFVAARFGLDEIGLRFVKLQQSVGKRGELEEEVLFGDGLGGPAAIRARVAGLGFVDVEVVEDAVLAGVRTLVDVAVLAAALEQIVDHAGVLRVGGALEVIDLAGPASATAVRNSAEMTSQNSLGVLPARSAARSTFTPCSSVPVVSTAS